MVSFNFFRYYYDKNIILKTAGKRYVYRFVCDLQGLLGYSPEEIHQMVDLKLEKKEEDWFFYIHEKRNSQEIEKKLFYKIQKNREKKIIPSNRRISSPTYSKSERRLAPPKSVGSKSASHEKRIQVRASLAENKKALLLCGPSYGIYLMIKNITVMWISLLLLKKELKKFVIVYFFDVVSVKEPKILEKMPKNVVCDRQFFCLNFCEIKL